MVSIELSQLQST